MITKNQNITTDKTSRDEELIDLGFRLGQACWDVYSRSKCGFPRVFMLPSAATRRRARELFQTGFSARMFVCPPVDTALETSEGEMMWEIFLDTMDGEVVLDFGTYPETPEFVLDWAKEFFLEGFRAGTIAVREIRKL